MTYEPRNVNEVAKVAARQLEFVNPFTACVRPTIPAAPIGSLIPNPFEYIGTFRNGTMVQVREWIGDSSFVRTIPASVFAYALKANKGIKVAGLPRR